uniref:MAT1-2-5 n=1 Tax=Eutiarosporella pseudodarliae TaxID=1686410 RepID=A0A2D1GT40_9PEZI|nr:MAT1-2-5 [Eutiarosporella pseudodarliae]
MFAPARRFTLAGVQQSLLYHENNEKNEQRIYDSFSRLINRIDESGVLANKPADEAKHEVADNSDALADTPADEAKPEGIDKSGDLADKPADEAKLEVMPMDRSLTYAGQNSAEKQRFENELKTILKAEQELANHTLAMIKNDRCSNLLEKLGFSASETKYKKWQKHALKRIAMRQLLTESTDASLRLTGMVQRSENLAGEEMPYLNPIGHDGEWMLAMVQFAKLEAKHHRTEAAKLQLLEEIFSISTELNKLEYKILEKGLVGQTQNWFSNRRERLEHNILHLQLPKGTSRAAVKLRLLEARKRAIPLPKPQPVFWPLPHEQVARNDAGI